MNDLILTTHLLSPFAIVALKVCSLLFCVAMAVALTESNNRRPKVAFSLALHIGWRLTMLWCGFMAVVSWAAANIFQLAGHDFGPLSSTGTWPMYLSAVFFSLETYGLYRYRPRMHPQTEENIDLELEIERLYDSAEGLFLAIVDADIALANAAQFQQEQELKGMMAEHSEWFAPAARQA